MFHAWETRHWRVAAMLAQGRRDHMEDRVSVHADMPGIRQQCLAVGLYDGHGGHDVSTLLSRAAVNTLLPLAASGCGTPPVLAAATQELDGGLARFAAQGSTLTFVAISEEADGALHAVNVGDSPACVVRRGGTVIPVSETHSVDFEGVALRVAAAGGDILGGRVVPPGTGHVLALNMSRCMGDFDNKRVPNTPRCAQPQVALGSARALDTFSEADTLILCSDGIGADVGATGDVPAHAAAAAGAFQAAVSLQQTLDVLRDVLAASAAVSTDNMSLMMVRRRTAAERKEAPRTVGVHFAVPVDVHRTGVVHHTLWRLDICTPCAFPPARSLSVPPSVRRFLQHRTLGEHQEFAATVARFARGSPVTAEQLRAALPLADAWGNSLFQLLARHALARQDWGPLITAMHAASRHAGWLDVLDVPNVHGCTTTQLLAFTEMPLRLRRLLRQGAAWRRQRQAVAAPGAAPSVSRPGAAPSSGKEPSPSLTSAVVTGEDDEDDEGDADEKAIDDDE